MKLKRKKIGDRNYNLVDVATGEVVGNAVQTGEHGRDNYPWDWSLNDGRIFGRLDASTGSSTDSMRAAVDYIESEASRSGFLKPAGEVSGYDIKEGQVFRIMHRNGYYYYRATQDAYGEFNAYIPANDKRGDLTDVVVPHGQTVTLYTEA